MNGGGAVLLLTVALLVLLAKAIPTKVTALLTPGEMAIRDKLAC